MVMCQWLHINGFCVYGYVSMATCPWLRANGYKSMAMCRWRRIDVYVSFAMWHGYVSTAAYEWLLCQRLCINGFVSMALCVNGFCVNGHASPALLSLQCAGKPEKHFGHGSLQLPQQVSVRVCVNVGV